LKRFRNLRHYPIEVLSGDIRIVEMRTNIIGYFPVEGFVGRPAVSDLRDEIGSPEEFSPRKKSLVGGEVEELNAYKVAVLLAVGATILSVFN
jgi:hypothetical protein